MYVMIETGMRPSEIVNLQKHTIRLDAPIPYDEILPDSRQLKTVDSRRQAPLVSELVLAVTKHCKALFEGGATNLLEPYRFGLST